MGYRTQNIGMKLFIRLQIRTFDAQKILDCTGYIMAFAHFRSPRYNPLESLLAGFGMITQTNADKRNKTRPKRGPVEHSAIAFNHTRALKFLNPAQTGRRGQADPLRQIDVADPASNFKLSQYILRFCI